MRKAPTSLPASRVLGAILGVAALVIGCSLGLAAGGQSSWFAAPGGLFIGLFGWAAVYIPLWLALATLLALLPEFHPMALFCLVSSLGPFILIAAYARLSLDPERWFTRYPLLEALGLPALGVATFLVVLFLALLIVRLALLLFPSRDMPRRERGRRPGLGLPPPLASAAEENAPPLAAGRPTPTETSSSVDTVPRQGPQEESEFTFTVPDLPPLPRLRSLGESEEVLPATEETEEPLHAEAGADNSEASATVPETAPTTPAEGGPSVSAAATPAEEAPVPLFFGKREPHPAPEPTPQQPSPGPAPTEPSSPQPQAPAGEGSATVELPGAHHIEFTSVPPSQANTASAEEEKKAAAVARILARKKRPPYALPSEGILTQYPDGQYWIVDEKTRHSAEVLRETLAEFNIEAEVTGIRKGPVITMFEILPAPGVRLSKIANLADNIALRLAASSVRIVAPIPGKHAVGIEVPNERRSIVSLKEIVENETFKTSKMEVPVILGKDIAGGVQFIDLVQTPHLLIAGATGSGKSVCVNSIILSILFRRSPEEVRLLLIDPKIVELKLYNDIPHLLTPVITEPKRAFQALQYCICEMERRYSMLDRVGVRDVKSYNRKIREKSLAQERLPYIVVIIDEFADLMATTGKELESTLARLAAMSRAVGIHLVLATQRPSIDVITGLIKANIPSRIAFMVASKFDSRIIIDMVGAEKLLGRGDMLFASAWDPFPVRMQGAYVSEEEVERAVAYVKTLGEPEYIDEEIFIDDEEEESEPSLFDDGDGDPLFEQALEIVLQQGKASASYIQRKLKIGYNRAARIVELMEERGIVGPAQGSKPRPLVRNPEITGTIRPSEAGRRGPLMPEPETRPNESVSTTGAASSGEGLEDE